MNNDVDYIPIEAAIIISLIDEYANECLERNDHETVDICRIARQGAEKLRDKLTPTWEERAALDECFLQIQTKAGWEMKLAKHSIIHHAATSWNWLSPQDGFPADPNERDCFLKTDDDPPTVHRFVGGKWVDKLEVER